MYIYERGLMGDINDIVDAAWDAGVGVQALIWFGFNGGNTWMKRRDDLFAILHSNPKAKFVTRVVQFGSEPLFDNVLAPSALIAQVNAAKQNLASLHIPVTMHGDQGSKVLKAVDSIDAHILPFFSSRAGKGERHLVDHSQSEP
ncbi:hypothetical protein DXG01_007846 [Tephrocybe rancida]|nr:hypothetical protein DXG01_007846 [Tephrocybe rancida]